MGFLVSYVAPLVFVLALTFTKEAVEDSRRAVRDRELNDAMYLKIDLHAGRVREFRAADLRVGDLVKINSN